VTRHHYVYRLTDPATGRFYIGKRSSSAPPECDPYRGSGVWPKAMARAGRLLTKEVIACCRSEADAYAVEVALVSDARTDHLCKNFAAGGLGLTSDVAKIVMNRPERKDAARRSVLRFNSERVKVMRAKTTPEQRRAAGIAGGSAGRGVSRNVGDANPMKKIPKEQTPAYDSTVYRLRRVGDGAVWCGTKSQMQEQLGTAKHWYSLCSGKRKVCLGYAFDGIA
jgi:hypothetical protein